jgi:hypothetical protein
MRAGPGDCVIEVDCCACAGKLLEKNIEERKTQLATALTIFGLFVLAASGKISMPLPHLFHNAQAPSTSTMIAGLSLHSNVVIDITKTN